jgi:hypothetical protein
MKYRCNGAEYMRKVIPLVLLVISVCVALFISVLGVSEIVNLPQQSSVAQITNFDVYIRVLFFLIGIVLVGNFLERLNVFSEFENVKDNVTKINVQTSTLSDEVKNIKENNEYLISKIVPFFQRFETHKNRRFYELLWKYMFRGNGGLDNNDTLSVGPEASIHLWRDCISEANTWEAISYAKNLWQGAEQEISKAHQDVHVKLGGVIYRVFVFDTEEERNEFQHDEGMQGILSAGDIRWILKSNLINKTNKRYIGLEKVGLMDFAIADANDYVLWFKLLPFTKELFRAILTIDPTIVNQARTIFDIAYQNSQRFPQAERQPDQVREINERRLRILEEQQALHGTGTDPAITMEIQDLRRKLYG